MMRLPHSAVLVALALAVPALAQTASSAAKPKSHGSYSTSETKTVTATVTAIDLATRHVTLQLPDGTSQTFVVGPQARNLPQTKVGDQVVVQYQEAIEIDVTPADPTKPLPQPTEAVAVERSDPGKKPEGIVARTVTLTGTVEAYDPVKKIAIIKGSGGKTVEVQVKHPDRWTKVKVGDTITAKYSEALAIAVQPAGPTMPTPPPAKAPPAK
ncbi:MAG: hypothetical protein ACXWK8_07900 [Myxococcaceae bacterium]